jgi:hypothetical protein
LLNHATDFGQKNEIFLPQPILDSACNFSQSLVPTHEIYVNRKTKTVFSMDFIEDHDEEEIERRVQGDSGSEEWQFHFNAEPAESVRRSDLNCNGVAPSAGGLGEACSQATQISVTT